MPGSWNSWCATWGGWPRSGAVDPLRHRLLDYRTHPYHGLVFWLYTLGRNRLQPQMLPDEFSREIIKRITQSTIDHDTFALLKAQNSNPRTNVCGAS